MAAAEEGGGGVSGGSGTLDRYEASQLRQIGGSVYGDGNQPYWWGKATMPKLAKKGLVESHPKYPKAWRITDLGRVALRTLDHVGRYRL
jgi:hypothetical protein